MNSLAATPESVPCSFNTVLVDKRASTASGISEEEAIVHFEPVLQIDPRSPAPLQLTEFSRAQREKALANASEESENLHKCMNAMVNNGWVEYLQPNEKVKLGRRWQCQVPNDYPKAATDLLFRNGLVDSKQDFLLICLSQQGKPLNPKSTSIANTSNAMAILEKLLNPILSTKLAPVLILCFGPLSTKYSWELTAPTCRLFPTISFCLIQWGEDGQ